MKVKDELESSGWRLGMLLNTLKRLGRLPQLRTAWTQMSVMLQWRTPHLGYQSQLYKALGTYVGGHKPHRGVG